MNESKNYAELTKEELKQRHGQSETATCYMIPTIRHSEKGKTVETIERSVVSRS